MFIKFRKKEKQTFTFNNVSYEKLLNDNNKLETKKKTTKKIDIPTKFPKKENSEVFSKYFHKNKTSVMKILIFPCYLKLVDVTPYLKRNQTLQKITKDPSEFYPIHLRYMKVDFTAKLGLNLMESNLLFNVVFAKDLMHQTV